MTINLPQRFWAKTVWMADCLIWTGCVTTNGYGQVWFAGKPRRPHRVSYELNKGSISADLTIDHLCRNKLCINPHHLDAVTTATNTRRYAATITNCPRGHAYTPENTGRHSRLDGRYCKRCNRERQAKNRLKQGS